jgi:hypothetical protein
MEAEGYDVDAKLRLKIITEEEEKITKEQVEVSPATPSHSHGTLGAI